jgi:predicted phosphoribosyltransferase
MRFLDRADAGERLAPLVVAAVDGPAVVLGIPRGGVVVAVPVAAELDAPLDVVVPRKLCAPGNPELGLGAVAPGVRVLDERLVAHLGVTDAYLETEIAREEAEIARRTASYRADRPSIDLGGRTAVVVDDGVATGGTALAALAWARAQAPVGVVFAAPVGPPDTVARLADACDAVVVPLQPVSFFAVGQWYERFDQLTDDEVRAALGTAA